jgi:hypothetical protein
MFLEIIHGIMTREAIENRKKSTLIGSDPAL